MKFIVIIWFIATVSTVVITADDGDKVINESFSNNTAGSQRSIELLLKTVTKLVQ